MTSRAGAHERRDVDFRVVAAAGLAVLVAFLAAVAAMWPLVEHYARREAERSAPASPLAAAGPQRPPEPRLQADPTADLAALRASEEARLHGYAWVDRAAGRVRIPIERAMALLAEDGRP
jgi:hypothetical protein